MGITTLDRRIVLLACWGLPCLSWMLALLWLATRQPHAISSDDAGSAVFSLGQVILPTFTILISVWFRDASGRLPSMTANRFGIALLTVVIWGIYNTVYFWIHVVTVDYELAQACDEQFEQKVQSFCKFCIYTFAFPSVPLLWLFTPTKPEAIEKGAPATKRKAEGE